MSDEARLQRWLASQRNAAAEASSSDHIDAEMLARHAAGRLSGAKAQMVNEHLQVCEDGRCRAVVHAQLASQAPPAAADSRGSRDSGSATVTSTSPLRAGASGAARERTFQSRQIVWSTFESMARELGTPIDELISAAMAAYAQARGYAPGAGAEPPPPTVIQPAPRAQAPAPLPPPPGVTAMPVIQEMPPVHDPLADTNEAGVSALDRSYEKPPAPMPPHTDWDDDLARTSARGKLAKQVPSKTGAGVSRSSSITTMAPDSRTVPRRSPLATTNPAAEGEAQRLTSSSPPGRVGPAASQSGQGELPGGPVTHRMPNAPASPEAHPHARPGLRPQPRPNPQARPPELRQSQPVAQPPAAAQRGAAAAKRLVLTYQGRPHPVDKDRFLIGRSTTQSDLRLDDPNVSRQHAVIERVGAAWYIVDLGSTNGVHVAGERITRRAIADGDIIVVINHQIYCAMR